MAIGRGGVRALTIGQVAQSRSISRTLALHSEIWRSLLSILFMRLPTSILNSRLGPPTSPTTIMAAPTLGTYATWSGTSMTSTRVLIPPGYWPADINSDGFRTIIHETLHALGLGHVGPYFESPTYGVDNLFTNDTLQWSVLSHFAEENFGGSFDYVITPQMAISMRCS